ncbi:MAG: hypothetical protein KKB31_02550 [Nanoarchaeota archaeon]|nr:hypothetical protein [Nanoarchaeota archaeon]
MVKTLNNKIGKALILIGLGGILSGGILIKDNPKEIMPYVMTLASVGACTGGYKFFIEPTQK